mmetsp:Transcript_126449/g.393570  ORF Transcript_126449/g.393570 Transcript_126449/m.393570 type:complete len:200 (-) Transcript_126449:49-648(-)
MARWAPQRVPLTLLALLAGVAEALGFARPEEGAFAADPLKQQLSPPASGSLAASLPPAHDKARDAWLSTQLRAAGTLAKHVLTASPASIYTELTGHKLPILHGRDSKTIHEMIATQQQEWTARRSLQYICVTVAVGLLALLQLWGGFADKGGRARSPFGLYSTRLGGPPWPGPAEVELTWMERTPSGRGQAVGSAQPIS